MPVAYEEMDGSPVERWDANQANGSGITAERRLKCAWGDRYTLLREFLTPPGATYIHHGTNSVIRAVRGAVEPFPRAKVVGTATQASYSDALISLYYGTGNYSSTGELFSESIEPISEMLRLDHNKFRWKTGGEAQTRLLPDEAPSTPRRYINYVVTRYHLAAVPVEALALLDTVNATSIQSPEWGFTFDPGTLLFGTPDINRRVRTDLTTMGYDVSYRWAYNPGGWNKFYRPDIQAYDSLVLRSTGDVFKPFPEAYFGGLIWSGSTS